MASDRDHALAGVGDENAALGRWANRLGWYWRVEQGNTGELLYLMTEDAQKLGRISRAPGMATWRWRLGDRYKPHGGAAETIVICRNMLIAHALLHFFLTGLPGWMLDARDSGDLFLERDLRINKSVGYLGEPDIGNVSRMYRVGAASLGLWQVDAMTNVKHAQRFVENPFSERTDALACAVDRAMSVADQLRLVPGKEEQAAESEMNDGEIDEEQLGRTREALDGF